MERISSFDAKTHLSRLLANVADGAEYIITRHNQDIAKLTPCDNREKNTLEAIDSIKQIRAKFQLSLKEILEYKSDGRK